MGAVPETRDTKAFSFQNGRKADPRNGTGWEVFGWERPESGRPRSPCTPHGSRIFVFDNTFKITVCEVPKTAEARSNVLFQRRRAGGGGGIGGAAFEGWLGDSEILLVASGAGRVGVSEKQAFV